MQDAVLDTIGKRLRDLRAKANLTQEEVANYIGMTQSAYRRYESDEIKRFSSSIIEKLAEVLKSTPNYITGTETTITWLSHMPGELREWVKKPDALPYIAKAFLEYQQDKMKEYL